MAAIQNAAGNRFESMQLYFQTPSPIKINLIFGKSIYNNSFLARWSKNRRPATTRGRGRTGARAAEEALGRSPRARHTQSRPYQIWLFVCFAARNPSPVISMVRDARSEASGLSRFFSASNEPIAVAFVIRFPTTSRYNAIKRVARASPSHERNHYTAACKNAGDTTRAANSDRWVSFAPVKHKTAANKRGWHYLYMAAQANVITLDGRTRIRFCHLQKWHLIPQYWKRREQFSLTSIGGAAVSRKIFISTSPLNAFLWCALSGPHFNGLSARTKCRWKCDAVWMMP